MAARVVPALGAVVLGCVLGAVMGIGVAWAAAQHEVVQKHRSFRPGEIAIKAGDTISFVNDDFYDHNVYSETPGNEFNTGVQSRGEGTQVTLEQPGVVEVLCKIHQKMKLIVTVE